MMRLATNRIGFVMSPLVWIDDEPDVLARMATPANHFEIVANVSLSNGVTFEVARDGLFTFDFSNATTGHVEENRPPGRKGRHSDEFTHERLLLINALFACIHTAMLQGTPTMPATFPLTRKVAVRPNDLIEFWIVRGAVREWYVNDERTMLYMRGRNEDTIRERYVEDDRAERRSFLKPTHVEHASTILDGILNGNDARIIEYLDMIMRGCEAAESLDYSVALNLNWVVIESLIARLWQRWQDENATRTIEGKDTPFVTKERRDRLADHRSFTAAVMSEILSIEDIIPLRLYETLARLRKQRNDWIHKLNNVTAEAAAQSIRASQDMLRISEGIRLEVYSYLQMDYMQKK